MSDLLQVTLDDVMEAGRVLFGPAFRADGQAWRLDLKTTYRRRALETHPDRARCTGRTETDLAAEFRRVAEAYQILSQLAAGPLPAAPPPVARPAAPRRAPRARQRPASTRAQRQEPAAARPPEPPASPPPPAPEADAPVHRVRYSVHPEDMPRRKLRFAEYLYYSGRIPWTMFVEAIAWQRRQRPPIGRIAVEWGFIDPDDVNRILEERRVRGAQGVPFGEFAVRMGYLTSFQLLAVLGRQLRMQRRIGEYFVEMGIVEPGEMDELRRRVFRHNARFAE